MAIGTGTALALGAAGGALGGMAMSSSRPSTPDAPQQISAADEMSRYLFGDNPQRFQGVTDPRFQQMLLNAERNTRPGYTDLNLQEMNQLLMGSAGQQGLLDLADVAAGRSEATRSQAASAQREADVADVERLGGRASEAFLAANPQLAAALESAGGMAGAQANPGLAQLTGSLTGQRPTYGDVTANQVSADRVQADVVGAGALGDSLLDQAINVTPSETTAALANRATDLAQSEGRLTPMEMRDLEQQARTASVARGRGMDASSVANEMAARIEGQRGRQMEDLAMAANLNQQLLGATAADRQFAMGVQDRDQARQQFNVGAGLTAQQANQGANMQAALANQAAGMQTGMANRAFAAGQDQQQIQNLGQLAQLQSGQNQADRAYQLQLAGAFGNYASDPFQAILGRPANAAMQGQQWAGQAQAGLGQSVPQFFNPDVGVNLALQQQGNMMDYNAALYGSQAAQHGNMMGGAMAGLGSMAGAAMLMSDRAVKKNIERVGTTASGVGIYTWNYIWEDDDPGARHYGVMAQELRSVQPEAVTLTHTGHYAVDYSMINLEEAAA